MLILANQQRLINKISKMAAKVTLCHIILYMFLKKWKNISINIAFR